MEQNLPQFIWTKKPHFSKSDIWFDPVYERDKQVAVLLGKIRNCDGYLSYVKSNPYIDW